MSPTLTISYSVRNRLLETLQLGQPHVDGASAHPRTRHGHVLAGLGAFGAPARGLAFGTVAAADAGAGAVFDPRAGRRSCSLIRHFVSPPADSSTFDEVSHHRNQAHGSVGCPRVITECQTVRRPSVRRLSRCFQRVPMVLRTWVIFSWLMAAPFLSRTAGLRAALASASLSRRALKHPRRARRLRSAVRGGRPPPRDAAGA